MKNLVMLAAAMFSCSIIATSVSAAKILFVNEQYALVQAEKPRNEKWDSPYSIADMFKSPDFIGPGENVMDLVVAFIAVNRITKYNKNGHPIIFPGRVYKVPTKAARDTLNASIVELMSHAPLTGKDVGGSKESLALSIDVSTRKALFLAIVFLILLACVTLGYATYRIFLAAGAVWALRDMQDKIAELRKEAAGEKPQVQASVKASPPPNIRQALGAEGVYSEPLPAGVPIPPYPGALSIGEIHLNDLRLHTMKEVAEALEIIAVHVRRGIKLCNLPEWLRKHPEYAEVPLQNVITFLEMQERIQQAQQAGEKKDKTTKQPEKEVEETAENLADELGRRVAEEPMP